MVKNGNSTKLFAGVGLAVPRLGNVRLRLHFLRRGTSRGRYDIAFDVKNGQSLTKTEQPKIGYDHISNTITFAQGQGRKINKIVTLKVPEGFKKVNEKGKTIIFKKKGSEFYISPDLNGHINGKWKGAPSIIDLVKRTSKSATYDENLQKIGK